jgi:hypothetical protein
MVVKPEPEPPRGANRLVVASVAVLATGALLALGLPALLRPHPPTTLPAGFRDDVVTPIGSLGRPTPSLTPVAPPYTPPPLRARPCTKANLHLAAQAQPADVRPQGTMTVTTTMTNVAATACDPGPLLTVEYQFPADNPAMAMVATPPVLVPHASWSTSASWLADSCSTRDGPCRPVSPGYYRITVSFGDLIGSVTLVVRVLNLPPAPPPPPRPSFTPID